jgi:hypothetical protein
VSLDQALLHAGRLFPLNHLEIQTKRPRKETNVRQISMSENIVEGALDFLTGPRVGAYNFISPGNTGCEHRPEQQRSKYFDRLGP